MKFTTQLQTVKQNTSSIADKVMFRFYQVAVAKGFQDLGISLPKVYTTMPTWESNVPEQAVDGNTETFYWAMRAPNPDDTIVIDYGRITTAKQAVLLFATPIHGNDYFKQGICEFSIDGNTWFDQNPVTKAEVTIEIKQPFRYLRLRTEADQEHWILIREIELH
jgi:hyaluronoglucosaminidase